MRYRRRRKRSDLDDFVNCYFGRTGGTSSVSSKKKAGTEASPPSKSRTHSTGSVQARNEKKTSDSTPTSHRRTDLRG